MLQIDEAVLSDVVVTPSNLALGEIETGSVTKWLKLRLDDADDGHGHRWCRHGRRDHHDDDDDAPVTYTPRPSAGDFDRRQHLHAGAVLHGRDRHLQSADGDARRPPSPPRRHRVRRRHDHASWRSVAGAAVRRIQITLTPSDGGPVLRVPYAGYNGDYQAIPVMTLAGFPLLAQLTPLGFVPRPGGATFSLDGDDVPFILFHLNHQVARFSLEVVDVATGRALHFADDERFVRRNSAANTFFAFGWDGTTFRRPGAALRTCPTAPIGLI